MLGMPRLPRSFFARPTLTVARELLGQRLVRLAGRRLSGLIIETEAYIGQTDLACHARFGRTPRTEVLFGAPGHAYVYFTYGMHWMLNVVTEPAGFPAAVLIRAIVPVEGEVVMRARRRAGAASAGRRPVPPARLTDGPAKLAQALGIDGSLNGHDLCARGARLFVERAPPMADQLVEVGPRIGLNNTPEPWKSVAWNFRTHIIEGA
ncbi:MAG: DNA-3-methyladenine glycosylase [Anaerolineales bacterium]|nr:DNA-3-methyladenine glycosylase [Anaerolineales bacterium]